MKKAIGKFCTWFLQVSGISGAVLLAVCPISCKGPEEGLQMLQGDYTAPEIVSYTVPDPCSIVVRFSKKIQLNAAVITSGADSTGEMNGSGGGADGGTVPSVQAVSETEGAVPVSAAYDDTGTVMTLTASRELDAGVKYALYGEAADESGNTLTFCIPFTGFNSRVPRLIISEIHPGYVSGTNRTEFIELYALTAGNTAGLKIFSAGDGEDKGFELPAAEIQAGEVIVLHMRKKNGGCVSETGGDLSRAEGTEKDDYVSDTARDIWAENTKACLGEKEDVIVLENTSSGAFLDAVMYAQAGTAAWSKDSVKKAAERAAAAGIWGGTSPSSAVQSDGLTPTKTLARRGCTALRDAEKKGTLPAGTVLQSAGNWYMTDSKTASPGSVE